MHKRINSRICSTLCWFLREHFVHTEFALSAGCCDGDFLRRGWNWGIIIKIRFSLLISSSYTAKHPDTSCKNNQTTLLDVWEHPEQICLFFAVCDLPLISRILLRASRRLASKNPNLNLNSLKAVTSSAANNSIWHYPQKQEGKGRKREPKSKMWVCITNWKHPPCRSVALTGNSNCSPPFSVSGSPYWTNIFLRISEERFRF